MKLSKMRNSRIAILILTVLESPNPSYLLSLF